MKTKPVFGSRPFGKRDAKLLLVSYFDPNGIETIPQGIEAWQSLSRHEIVLLNLWPGRAGTMCMPATLDLDDFDGLVVHPTVSYSPASVSTLDIHLERGLAEFDGVKILMKQDEQVLAGRLPELVRDKGFDIVLTCVPPSEQEKVYPKALIGDCVLHQVLTGYVSPSMRGGLPKSVRDIAVSYRGSIQPLAFGRLGYEKRGVGYDMAAALSRHEDIRFDISSRWEDRLSGAHWDAFLARSGIVLGVESGANIFDFDGRVAGWCEDYARRHQGEDVASFSYYRNAHDEYLHTVEGNVDYAQISPRHFEAAAAGAAQLLYEGTYSEIFRPREHFFPLRRDLGNLEEVLDFIRDGAAQRQMAERSYEEIILDPRNWYEAFVASADDAVDAKLAAKGRQRAPARSAPRRPLAYVLAAHDPVTDPRTGWFASSLARTHDVVVIGACRFDETDDGPTLQDGPDGIRLVRVERTKHDAAWIPPAAQLRRQAASTARSLLASLVGYAAAPDAVLAGRLGSHVAVRSELDRFRTLCADMVNTNSALMDAVGHLGAPDVVVAANLDTLFAAVACGEDHGCPVVFDARDHWPYSFTDFQHWEIEFWSAIEARLSKAATLCVTTTPQLAQKMSHDYGARFASLPNAATKREGELEDLQHAFARRAENGPLRVLYQGGFAHGCGLEAFIQAWSRVKSDAVLVLSGPDNGYRQTLIGLARSLGLDESRMEFPEAVPEGALIRTALEADIGLVPCNPAFFGYRYCCPRELSRYAAAGLPILSSPTEFVAGMVREHGIGYVVELADPQTIADLVDRLAERRAELVARGRRARALFETAFNWDVLAAPVLDEIARFDVLRSGNAPDFRWIECGAAALRKSGRSAPPVSPVLFGGDAPQAGGLRDVADAEEGASVVASSPFHARPNDADYLLRRGNAGGYAAAFADGPLPHWIEIDLGSEQAIEAVEIEWYGPDSFATDYRVLRKNAPKADWKALVEVSGNESVEARHPVQPCRARYVRLEASGFHDDPRLLIRAFRLIEAVDPSAVAGEKNQIALEELGSDLQEALQRPPLDLADAEEGAFIVASSPFHARPNDADYLLRRGNTGGYAAAFADGPLPHWIEIDLGSEQAIEAVEIEWYGPDSFATDYRILRRSTPRAEWSVLVETTANESVEARYPVQPCRARYVRLEASRFRGDPRLLIRAFRLIEAARPPAIEQPARRRPLRSLPSGRWPFRNRRGLDSTG